MNNLYPWDTDQNGDKKSDLFPWNITPDMTAKEKCDAHKSFMENRYGKIFEYKVQYKWPEKCRPTVNPDHIFTTIGYYRNIGEFFMWNPSLSEFSEFTLVRDSEKERKLEFDIYKRDSYYDAVMHGYKIDLEERLRFHLMSISMTS